MKKQLLFALGVSVGIVLFAGSCSKAKEDKLAAETPVDSVACDTVNMTYSSNVVPVLTAKCYSCHGNNSSGGSGGINLNSYENLKLYADNGVLAGNITHAPGFVGMPYNQPKMDDCTINTILDWINRGHRTIKIKEMKLQFLIIAAILCCSRVMAQPIMTRTGFIGFYSQTSLEDIKAENHQAYAIIDTTKKDLAFAVLLKGFSFPRQLMQEHFNENYVESDKFPKATFSGSYTPTGSANAAGETPVTVKGNLTLHGVTKPVETTATLSRKPGVLAGKTTFHVKPEDYNISIPALVRDKISKELQVQVDIAWTTK